MQAKSWRICCENSRATAYSPWPSPAGEWQTITLPAGDPCEFTAASGSLERIWLDFCLNDLRLDQLYMLMFECRRLLPVGGTLLLTAAAPGEGWEKLWGRFTWKFRAGTPLRTVEHYVSPEDWQSEELKREKKAGVTFEYWRATRLDTPAS